MTNARAVWDAEQIARAVGFTTSRFLGVGRFDTRRFGALPAALADARGDRRALVYAITPEGWTIHIANGDRIPMETAMTATTKSYTEKSNAIRAARSALRAKYPEPMSGVHFKLDDAGDGWVWHEMDPASGQIATAEHIEDGAAPTSGLTPLPIVTLPNDTRSARRKKADAAAQAEGFPNAIRAADIKRAGKAAAEARAPGAPKEPGRKAAALLAAQGGELPIAPDFSKPTHARFRKTLEQLVAFVEAGDIKGLKADKTEPASSSRAAMCRYRDLAITALEARARPKAA